MITDDFEQRLEMSLEQLAELVSDISRLPQGHRIRRRKRLPARNRATGTDSACMVIVGTMLADLWVSPGGAVRYEANVPHAMGRHRKVVVEVRPLVCPAGEG